MKASHLAPSVAAMLVLAVATYIGLQSALLRESEYANALAGSGADQKLQGSALQAAIARQPDLLPLYGGSEASDSGPYSFAQLFQEYPTGFSISIVVNGGYQCLDMLQALAAVGPDLRGKKVVVTLVPTNFSSLMVPSDAYAGNFSRLHAGELAFSTALDLSLKRKAAERMLQYPRTLEKDPLLRFALEALASNSSLGDVAYYAVLPLGKLQNLGLSLQDHFETVSYLQQNEISPKVTRKPAKLDWASLTASAEQAARQQSSSNPFGIDDERWQQQFRDSTKEAPEGSADRRYVDNWQSSLEWVDLDLLLVALKELGAEPLLISLPLNGPYYDYVGLSATARQVYYRKLHSVVDPYGVPVVDFADHDGDRYFSVDPFSHPSPLGQVYIAQTLDAFYHGTLGGPAGR